MGMKKTILLVGTSCQGTSIHSTRMIEYILASVAMTMHEPIIYGDKIMTGEEIQEEINQKNSLQTPEPIELKMLNVPDYEPTIVVEEPQPFAKFRGTKNKWQR